MRDSSGTLIQVFQSRIPQAFAQSRQTSAYLTCSTNEMPSDVGEMFWWCVYGGQAILLVIIIFGSRVFLNDLPNVASGIYTRLVEKHLSERRAAQLGKVNKIIVIILFITLFLTICLVFYKGMFFD